MRGIALKLPHLGKHTIFHCIYRLYAGLDNAEVGINRIVAIPTRLLHSLYFSLFVCLSVCLFVESASLRMASNRLPEWMTSSSDR